MSKYLPLISSNLYNCLEFKRINMKKIPDSLISISTVDTFYSLLGSNHEEFSHWLRGKLPASDWLLGLFKRHSDD